MAVDHATLQISTDDITLIHLSHNLILFEFSGDTRVGHVLFLGADPTI
jgi:hypothetical protein